MNFIIEILPKKENGSVFVYVVRNGNGYPMSVCESLDGAKDFIAEKIDDFKKTMSEKANK